MTRASTVWAWQEERDEAAREEHRHLLQSHEVPGTRRTLHPQRLTVEEVVPVVIEEEVMDTLLSAEQNNMLTLFHTRQTRFISASCKHTVNYISSLIFLMYERCRLCT